MTQKTQLTEAAKKRRAINFNAGGASGGVDLCCAK